jgi:hypothetical protein
MRTLLAGVVAAGIGMMMAAGSAQAQTAVVPDFNPEPTKLGSNPSQKALEIEAERLWNKRRYDALQELRRIRGQHFHNIKDDAKRSAGIAKVRTFTDPAAFGPMLDVLEEERDDVLLAMVDVFDQDKGNAGEAALIAALFELESPAARQSARTKVSMRLASTGTLGPGARQLIDAAIRGSSDARRMRALEYVSEAGLVEFIPSLMNGQTITKGADDPGGGDTANITIGNQLTYVARLRPVVSEGAAAFDPEVGTLNTGTQLRVRNVFVTIRRVEVNAVLVKMADELTGQDTSKLGYDADTWKAWYEKAGGPQVQKVLDARVAAAKSVQSKPAAEPQAQPTSSTPDMTK